MRARRIVELLPALLFASLPFSPWAGSRLYGEEAKRVDVQPGVRTGVEITVRQDRLSVDLMDVELQEVLAEIGKQAGVRIVFLTALGKRVTARFTELELDAGLRRLLGLAAVNHAILYAQGSAGAFAIEEVRVLGETTVGPSEISSLAPTEAPVSPPSRAPFTGEEGEGARRFREAVGGGPQPAPSPTESEAAQRFLGAVGGGRQPAPSLTEDEGVRRFREALEGARQLRP